MTVPWRSVLALQCIAVVVLLHSDDASQCRVTRECHRLTLTLTCQIRTSSLTTSSRTKPFCHQSGKTSLRHHPSQPAHRLHYHQRPIFGMCFTNQVSSCTRIDMPRCTNRVFCGRWMRLRSGRLALILWIWLLRDLGDRKGGMKFDGGLNELDVYCYIGIWTRGVGGLLKRSLRQQRQDGVAGSATPWVLLPSASAS